MQSTPTLVLILQTSVSFGFVDTFWVRIYFGMFFFFFSPVFRPASKMSYFTAFSREIDAFYTSPSTSPASFSTSPACLSFHGNQLQEFLEEVCQIPIKASSAGGLASFLFTSPVFADRHPTRSTSADHSLGGRQHDFFGAVLQSAGQELK